MFSLYRGKIARHKRKFVPPPAPFIPLACKLWPKSGMVETVIFILSASVFTNPIWQGGSPVVHSVSQRADAQCLEDSVQQHVGVSSG